MQNHWTLWRWLAIATWVSVIVTGGSLLALAQGPQLTEAQPATSSHQVASGRLQDHPKIQSFLYALVGAPSPLAALKDNAGMLLSYRNAKALGQGHVQVVVEAHTTGSLPHLEALILALGGALEATYETSVQATLPLAALSVLADDAAVTFIRLPVQRRLKQSGRGQPATNSVTSEGVAVMQAAPWHDAGLTGAGVTVGIIDTFKDFERLLGTELPDQKDVRTESFATSGNMFNPDESAQIAVHGTGVAEIVHDVAPAAGLSLAYFETDVELRQAMEAMIEQQVDVVNTSLGLFSGCLSDVNQSLFEPIFARAKQHGITWVAAASNEGDKQHYAAQFQDADGDGQHDFTTDDNTLSVPVFMVEDFVSGHRQAVGIAVVDFGWSGDCRRATDDFDLQATIDEDAPRSAKAGFQTFSDWLWRPGYPIKEAIAVIVSDDLSLLGTRQTIHFSVRQNTPEVKPADLELLFQVCTCAFGNIEYLSTRGSISLTEPSQSPNVLSIGAVHQNPARCSQSLCPDGRLLVYSSKGPTPQGALKPDFVAPTHVSTVVYGAYTGEGITQNSGFTGTSAAAPHAAGAAALVLGAFPDFSPEQVAVFLADRSEDFGKPGQDDDYGAGLILLGHPPTAQDQTPPQAPAALRVEPDGWSNQATFTLEWESNPQDSDVVAAWYKLGQAPQGDSDGVRVTTGNFSVTLQDEGETPIYVWLEDAQGNANHLNRLSSVLHYDATPPLGKMRIDDGQATTTQTEVSLSFDVSDEGGSGVSEVRLSEDGQRWTAFEPFQTERRFELSEGFGFKTVFAQFKDRAQNVSQVVVSSITFILRSQVEAAINLNHTVDLSLLNDVKNDLDQADLSFREALEEGENSLTTLGLTLDPNTGNISGTATRAGSFQFEVEVLQEGKLIGVVTVLLQVSLAQVALAPQAVVEGSVMAQGLSDVYVIEVPEHTARLVLQARSLDGGDIDLYVRTDRPLASIEELLEAEFASLSPASKESISIEAPNAGTYYVSVMNREAQAQTITIAGTLHPAYAPVLEGIELGLPLQGQVEAAALDASALGGVQFEVNVVEGSQQFAVLLETLGPGTLRLHVRFGKPVAWVNGGAVSDWQSESRTGVDSVVVMGQALKPGTYYIAIENLDPFAQRFSLQVQVE